MKNIQNLDIVFFLVTFFIVILASFRGLIKEFFSFINWVLAFGLSYLLSPFFEDMFQNFFDSKIIMNLVIRISIFIISFIVFLLLTDTYSKELTDNFNIIYNRIFGFIFGCFKSMLLFGVVFSLYNCFFDYALGQRLLNKNTNRLPRWYIDSYSSSIISFSGDLVDPAVRGFISFFQLKSDDFKLDLNNKLKYDYNQNQNSKNENTNNYIKIDDGYDKKDIEKMQKLIEIIN